MAAAARNAGVSRLIDMVMLVSSPDAPTPRMRQELGILKRGEKGQERIVGFISADRGIRWCDSFQCPFLDRKICLDVDVCRLDAFVAKPKSDHGPVDSGL